MRFDCCGGIGWHAPYCHNEPHEPALYDIATEQENVAFLALAFARSWAAFRHADHIEYFPIVGGLLTYRHTKMPVGPTKRDKATVLR